MEWKIYQKGTPATYISDCKRFVLKRGLREVEELSMPIHGRERWSILDASGATRRGRRHVIDGREYLEHPVKFTALRSAKLYSETRLAARVDARGTGTDG